MGRKRIPLVVNLEALSARMKATEDKDEYRRLQCLHLWATRPEMSVDKIGQTIGFGSDNVERLIRSYRKSGDLSFAVDKRGGRHNENMTLAEEQAFLASFETQASAASLVCAADIKAAYEQRVGHPVADSVISRLLVRNGWHKVAPYLRHPKGDPKAQQEFRDTFADRITEALKDANPAQLPVRVMFQDEGRFGRMVKPKRCWAPQKTRPEMPQQQIREYTYAYAAVSPVDGVMDSLILPNVNTESMSLFLAEVGQRHLDEFILMFADLAAWHTTAKLKVPDNIKLCDLPPYSPQLNPAEHIWEEIREKYFPNYAGKSLDQVENNLAQALLELEKDHKRVQSLAGFHWIVSVLSNAS